MISVDLQKMQTITSNINKLQKVMLQMALFLFKHTYLCINILLIAFIPEDVIKGDFFLFHYTFLYFLNFSSLLISSQKRL